MQKIFNKPAELEKLSKEKFLIPPFLMMENAARAMAELVLSKVTSPQDQVLILCGKGNNGGDGFALARLLQGKTQIILVAPQIPTAQEAFQQYQMCRALNIPVFDNLPSECSADIIVDCLYGIGFHGELQAEAKALLDKLNQMSGIKIACDIPSALYFKADFTITMGQYKTALFSDAAKTVCGKVIAADLGIARDVFEAQLPCDAFLIEEKDIVLPLRTNKAAHKGSYGHTAVFAGEKSGAAIIAATAAMNFGSGLTTLIKTEAANLGQFKISPELMIADNLPAKTTAIVAGPGFGPTNQKALDSILNWLENTEKPSAVFDADILTRNDISEILDKVNNLPEAKIILTPHLSELSRLLLNIKTAHPESGITEEMCSVKNLSENSELKLTVGKLLNRLYPKTTVIMKSANTFIASGNEVYICTAGVQSLAKGGSGDVLAGMAGALLAQNYSAQDAAITAVEAHGIAAFNFGEEAYNLSPEKLISRLSAL